MREDGHWATKEVEKFNCFSFGAFIRNHLACLSRRPNVSPRRCLGVVAQAIRSRIWMTRDKEELCRPASTIYIYYVSGRKVRQKNKKKEARNS